MQLITDQYGRSFKTLRVSLLSRCNLSCVYCTMGADEIDNHTSSKTVLSSKELINIIQQLHARLQLQTIRLTGGEPLLYHDLVSVISAVKDMGIPEIKLTTNAFLLERMAKPMQQAGMQSINVSLDAIDGDVFFLMSKRGHVQRILDGIEAALEAGLQVKINTVIMKGMNDSQILPLLQYAFEKNISIRFLEVMAMGHLHTEASKYLFTQYDILNRIATKYNFKRLKRNTSSTSNYWQTDKGNIFGIIANESEPFCHDCNRLRLDSEGNLFGCLSNSHPVSLKNIHDTDVLTAKLQEALLQKQAVKFTGSELSMLHIGG